MEDSAKGTGQPFRSKIMNTLDPAWSNHSLVLQGEASRDEGRRALAELNVAGTLVLLGWGWSEVHSLVGG